MQNKLKTHFKLKKLSTSVNMHNINETDFERCLTCRVMSLSSAYSHAIKFII